jgi:hypothetical protein
MLNQIGNYSSLLCVGAPQGARLPVLLICIIKKLYIEVMGGCANLACQATPNFFDSIMFRAVRGAILGFLNKKN